jgi:hypothetical protein
MAITPIPGGAKPPPMISVSSTNGRAITQNNMVRFSMQDRCGWAEPDLFSFDVDIDVAPSETATSSRETVALPVAGEHVKSVSAAPPRDSA